MTDPQQPTLIDETSGQAADFPEPAPLSGHGPARIIAGLDAFLHAAVARGELDIPDTREAAGQFLCLLKGEVNLRMLCGPIRCVHGDDDAAHVDSVVTLFLRAYRPVRG